jgi:hypothetical protein
MQGCPRDLGERQPVVRRCPARVSSAEGEHPHLGGQARGHLVGPSRAQRIGHGRGQTSPLEQFPFL